MNRMSFKNGLSLSIALVASLPLFASGNSNIPDKPNVIYILADDLGYGDLGCYGQKDIKTPNLDRMATQGMLFTQSYSGSTVYAPSRSCLLTVKHESP